MLIDSIEETVCVPISQRNTLVDSLIAIGFVPEKGADPYSSITFSKKENQNIVKVYLSLVGKSYLQDENICFIYRKIYTTLDSNDEEINHRDDKKPSYLTYYDTGRLESLRFMKRGGFDNEVNYAGLVFYNLETIYFEDKRIQVFFNSKEGMPISLVFEKSNLPLVKRLTLIFGNKPYCMADLEEILPFLSTLSLQDKLNLQRFQPQIASLLEMILS